MKTCSRKSFQGNHFRLFVKAKAPLLIAITIAISGCGGGGGSSSTVPEPDIVQPIDPTVPVQPIEPIDLSNYTIAPGTYVQQTATNVADAWAAGYKGNGITIGFVDSGINPNHIEFYGEDGYSRIDWEQARGVVSEDGYEIEINYDYVDIDSDYHGTHISSIAAGREFGLAPEATILPVNVFFDNSTAYNTAIHAAVDYLANKSPIVNASITDMVNLSTVGGSESEYNNYLTTLQNNNTVLVTAAGNGGVDAVGDPIGAEHFINYDTAQNLSIDSSIVDQVLHVIALDSSTGSIASFSNYPGDCTDVGVEANLTCDTQVMTEIQNNFISVPGTNIEAAYGADNTSSIAYNGTSMATPIVSGGLAVLLSGWDQLTPQQAVSILKESANNTGIYADAATYGVGLMDLQAALQPLGDLKSAASVSEPASSFTLNQSTASIPSELKSLAKLPELAAVAYFDKYDRDYSIDVSSMLQVDKQAIEWNQFWASQPDSIQVYQLDHFNLTVGYDNASAYGINHLKLSSADQHLNYAVNSSDDFFITQFADDVNHFHNMNQQEYGHSLSGTHKISPHLSLLASYQSPVQDNMAWQDPNADLNHSKQSQTLGLNYQLNDHLNLAVASQIIKQEEELMDAYGSGVFAFGENNLSQHQLVSMNYRQGKNQLFGLFKYGQLTDSTASSGSYIEVENAKFAEMKFGLIHNSSAENSWGVQAYNANTLMDSKINLTLPTGLTADGQLETSTVSYHHKGSLQPDSVEMFYSSQLGPDSRLQLNMLKTPDDSGVGLYVRSRF